MLFLTKVRGFNILSTVLYTDVFLKCVTHNFITTDDSVIIMISTLILTGKCLSIIHFILLFVALKYRMDPKYIYVEIPFFTKMDECQNHVSGINCKTKLLLLIKNVLQAY